MFLVKHVRVTLRKKEQRFDRVCLIVEGRDSFGRKVALADVCAHSLINIKQTAETRLDVHAVILLRD